MIVVDRARCRLYELFDAHPLDGRRPLARGLGRDLQPALEPAAPARLDVRRRRRPADPARARALPRGEARPDRPRAPLHRVRDAPRFIYPARHFASSLTDPDLPAMGQRLRLKRGFDISRLPAPVADRAERAQALRDDRRRQRLVLVRQRRAEPRLGQRRPPLAARRARQRVRGGGHVQFAPPLAPTAMRPVRVGCSGWQYDSWRGSALPGRASPRGAGSSATRRFSTRSRSTRPSTGSPRPRRSRAGSSRRRRTSCSPQGEPLHDAHQAAPEPRGRDRPLLRGDRAARRVRQARPDRLAVPGELPPRRRPARPGAAAAAARTPLLRVPARELVHRGRSTSSCARTTPRS